MIFQEICVIAMSIKRLLIIDNLLHHIGAFLSFKKVLMWCNKKEEFYHEMSSLRF